VTPDEIQALLELQELDLKLLEYERHQDVLDEEIEKIEAPVKEARDRLEKLENELTLAKNQHKHFELELVANNDKFKKLQTQQMGVRNQVEFEAFNHEMEALKERADSLEESGIKWIERAEEAERTVPEAKEALEAAEKAAAEQRSELDAKTAELKRIHDEASALKAPLVDRIPNNVMSYYKRLRRRGRTPFAAVIRRGACSGCGFTHPPQRLQEIKQARKLISCEQCGRIQVWLAEEEEQVGF
jgi:predicted  nucleic acid-binding Zn-ribbon protein